MRRWRPTSADLVGLASLAALIVLPLVAAEWVAGDFAVYFTYALFAVSLAFIWGHVGLLSLGHAVYFGIGAYAMSIVTLGMVPGLPGLRSTFVGLAASVFAAGGAAYLLGWFFFASRGLKGAFLGIVTLALAVVFERVAVNSNWLGGMNGLMNVPPIALGPNGGGPELYDAVPLYYAMLATLAVVTAA